ncbi:MAG: ion transporter [Flavobacteriales bacterium]|nr:ion transporter [Bacteroidota bacterium]MCB9241836.1 ion transporter [Flavobacteriales bacterium]
MPRPSVHDIEGLNWRQRWHRIIFEADTREGVRFDVMLLWAILASVCVVMLSSVPSFNQRYRDWLTIAEWVFTVVFSIEYFLRIFLSDQPRKYLLSFWGIIDLLSTIPTYLSLVIEGPQYLLMIRILRLLRIFRILSLRRYSDEARSLGHSVRASGAKITVFFAIILIIVVLMGTLMYIIEGPENGFQSIPFSIYWAIVTITTVGYGDVTPGTVMGQALSSALMIIGYAVIAVPTGIVSVEFAQNMRSGRVCPRCGLNDVDNDANYCKQCGLDMRSDPQT